LAAAVAQHTGADGTEFALSVPLEGDSKR
jgi:hypothetical protein